MTEEDPDRQELTVIPDRPPSLDEKGTRLFVIPAKVKGKFRSARNWVYSFLLFVFLVVPWTNYQGEQSIFLDIIKKRFVFFGHTFFSHDGPLLFFLLALVVFTIVFFTAVLGRVWCGWACPQTVFIDFVYRRIEEWIEGNHLMRRKLGQEDWSFKKVLKKVIKWCLFFLVSSHIAHSFTAYFVGAKSLVWLTMESPMEHWGLFLWVQIFTILMMINFGWFREQFCLIVCPYGRLQSTLMDKNSLAIMYDTHRGEPRKKRGIKDQAGDCIDCLRCVNVCPTGIDIRNGLQMECIACTACIDVCDEVMVKIKKPVGLIRYSSEAELSGEKRRSINLRTLVYASVLVVLITGLVTALSLRSDVDVKIVRAIEAPYSFVGDGEIINHFRIHVTNQTSESIQLENLILLENRIQLVSPQLRQKISAGESKWIHIFMTFSKELVKNGRLNVKWILNYSGTEKKSSNGSLVLLSP